MTHRLMGQQLHEVRLTVLLHHGGHLLLLQIGFIHRDIKPTNLVIGRRGTAAHIIHLLEFGLAREYIMRSVNGQVGDGGDGG